MNPYQSEYAQTKNAYEQAGRVLQQLAGNPTENKDKIQQQAQKVQSLKAAYENAKKKYDSYGVDPTSDESTVEKNDDTKKNVTPTSKTSTTAPKETTSSGKYTAPNGKVYTITKTGNLVSFNGGYGEKTASSVLEAKKMIDDANPKVGEEAIKEKVEESTTAVDTAKEEVKQEAEKNKEQDINAWESVLGSIKNIDTGGVLSSNIETLRSGYETAANQLKAASELEQEAQKIYSAEQMEAQKQQLIKQGLDPAKAQQAALYMNLKGKADIATKVKTIQADYEKTLANLETQKAQLINTARNQGLQNEQWVAEQEKAIETQIQNIKNNYQQLSQTLDATYTLQPLLDVNSTNMQAEAATIAQQIQSKFDTSTPERKIAGLARALGDSFAYIDSSIYDFIDYPFEDLLVKAAEIIITNQTKQARAVK